MFRRRDWFEELFGFVERTSNIRQNVHQNISVANGLMTSHVNHKSYRVGNFSTPSLKELRSAGDSVLARYAAEKGHKLRVANIVADVSTLMVEDWNKHATFQAASQFNCLEFVGPRVVPEQGVTGYIYDHTQGPACSIACGPATVYRNYFHPILKGTRIVKKKKNRPQQPQQPQAVAVDEKESEGKGEAEVVCDAAVPQPEPQEQQAQEQQAQEQQAQAQQAQQAEGGEQPQGKDDKPVNQEEEEEEEVEEKEYQYGQTKDLQIDNLCEIHDVVGNRPIGKLFHVVGGYTLAEDEQLEELNKILKELERAKKLDDVLEKLRIGVHDDVQVTSSEWADKPCPLPDQTITQVFGSACSVAYSGNGGKLWAPFASLVLKASYESTLYAALLAMERHKDEANPAGHDRVYLTLLGGGVFGNSASWIIDAMDAAFQKFKHTPLKVFIVNYGGVPPNMEALAKKHS